MLAQWTPPIAIPTSTGPAPGTGYEPESSWWKDPLSDLFEGATEKIREELGIRDERDVALELEAPQPVQRAGIAGTGLTMTELLLWGGFLFGGLQLALNYAAVRKPRRRR